jgi:hypothetical protein
MEYNANAQRNPDPVSFPGAAHHAFSIYTLAFDEFSEPRTIPAHWDLTGLMAREDRSNSRSSVQPDESPTTERAEGK